jgi:hypothetical protein
MGGQEVSYKLDCNCVLMLSSIGHLRVPCTANAFSGDIALGIDVKVGFTFLLGKRVVHLT